MNEKVEKSVQSIDTLVTQIEDLKKSFQARIREEFLAVTKVLFEAYPRVKSVHFKTWIPSFNDGDECTFTSTHDDPYFNGHDSEREEHDSEEEDIQHLSKKEIYDTGWKRVPNPDFDPAALEAVSAWERVLGNIPEDIIRELCGVGSEVTITSTGIHIDEYDCGY